MKIDMHVHLADIDALLASRQADSRGKPNRHLDRMLRAAPGGQAATGAHGSANEQWIRRVTDWVNDSQLDRVVLLALDAVFNESGESCPGRTALHVDNEFIGSVAACDPAFMFGASIHPYRRDAVEALERLIGKGACLIKWIPSGQHIEPDNPLCFPFYEALAHYGIPLLSHTGIEHTLGSRRSSYNHPKRLVPALERGVTVIAAHCGTHLFLHEPSFFNQWAALARKHERLYGDTGAFSIVTRIPYLKRILGDDRLRSKLLYGSDFPGIPSPLWCWQLGFRRMRALARMRNPLERNLRVMQALGMPDAVFSRTCGLLGEDKEIRSSER